MAVGGTTWVCPYMLHASLPMSFNVFHPRKSPSEGDLGVPDFADNRKLSVASTDLKTIYHSCQVGGSIPGKDGFHLR